MFKFKTEQTGFTLLEVLVAIGIFAIVITTAVGLFVNGSNSQKKINELHSIQSEGSFLLEKMSREIRMAQDENISKTKPYDITFTNYNNNSVTYCLADEDGVCKTGGPDPFQYLARNGKIINSSNMIISSLKFYIVEGEDIQPLIIITMEIKSKNENASLFLQNAVVPRVY